MEFLEIDSINNVLFQNFGIFLRNALFQVCVVVVQPGTAGQPGALVQKLAEAGSKRENELVKTIKLTVKGTLFLVVVKTSQLFETKKKNATKRYAIRKTFNKFKERVQMFSSYFFVRKV